jgi:hypothetical protein
LSLGRPRRVVLGVGIFGLALLLAAFGLLPIQVAFMGAAVAMIMARIISLGKRMRALIGRSLSC